MFFTSKMNGNPWPWPRRSSTWPLPGNLQVLENAFDARTAVFFDWLKRKISKKIPKRLACQFVSLLYLKTNIM